MIRLLIIIITLTANSYAQDHLIPERSQFSGTFFPEYTAVVLDAYREIYSDETLVRVVVLPSFRPEHAIAIKKDAENYMVVYLTTSEMFWSRFGEGNLDEKLDIIRKERDIDDEIAEQLIAAWEAILLETRYVDYRNQDTHILGLDGVNYHFAMKGRRGVMAGTTWSPDRLSKPGLLVNITEDLVSFCNGSDNSLRSIQSTLNKLQLNLSSGN